MSADNSLAMDDGNMSMDEAVTVIEEHSEFQNLNFQEAVSKYDLVGAKHDPIEGSYVLLADRPRTSRGEVGGLGFREMAYSSPSPWTAWTREERVPQLRDKQGIRTYYDMKRADGTVRGSLRVLKTPIQAAEWFVKPATDSSRDQKIAEFIEDNLFNGLNISWSRFIEDALTMCELGYCADPETQILTREGWKDYKSLNVGDMIYTLDQETLMGEWQPVEKVNIFNGKYKVRRIKTREHDSLTTLNHRWPVLKYDTKKFAWTNSKLLNTNDVILNGAEDKDIPRTEKYDSLFVELVAWFFTEGNWYGKNKNGSALWQKVYKKKVYNCLYKLFGPPVKKINYNLSIPQWRVDYTKNGVYRFGFSWHISHELKKVCDLNKAVSKDFIYSLTKEQLKLFVDTAMLGDGDTERNRLWQAVPSRIDAIELACILLGKSVNINYKNNGKGLNHSYRVEHRPIAAVSRSANSIDEQYEYVGDVWCPTVKNGTWLARRGNKTYFTGNSPFEKVYTYDEREDRIKLKKLAHRHPLDVREWIYDENGGPDFLIMEPLDISGWQEIPIPINKLLVFVFEQEGGDLRGTSILRSAYQHYYYKKTLYAIDAIQKERHGIGVPLIKLPMGFTPEDRKLADELGRNLRTNERAHITVPANWEVCFAKLEGQPVSCIESIKHHDKKIMSNVLTPFLDEPTESEKQDMFYKSTRYIAHTISDTINKHCIPELVDMNFMRHGGYPKLMVRRIGEWEDIRTMTFAARNLVGAQMLTPDDNLEDYIRDQLFLPPMDKDTARSPVQGPTFGDNQGEESASSLRGNQRKLINPTENVKPPKVGMPRQKSDPPVKPPKGNSGTDRSGG